MLFSLVFEAEAGNEPTTIVGVILGLNDASGYHPHTFMRRSWNDSQGGKPYQRHRGRLLLEVIPRVQKDQGLWLRLARVHFSSIGSEFIDQQRKNIPTSHNASQTQEPEDNLTD